ncbi:MAG: DUF523 domain-containing protein [Methylocystaceae bacterium]
MLGFSACLAGINCKYTGGNNLRAECKKIADEQNVLLVCPEVITSLGCPREPAEIVGNGGGDGVWHGTARVVTASGKDVTEQFKEGALLTWQEIEKHPEITSVILQPRSPSCGLNFIYDGTFSGRLVHGDGVLVSLLKQHGITVMDVEEFLNPLSGEIPHKN